MMDKDTMDQVNNVLNKMTPAEKAKKAESLQKLMQDELNRRKMQNAKKPKK